MTRRENQGKNGQKWPFFFFLVKSDTVSLDGVDTLAENCTGIWG